MTRLRIYEAINSEMAKPLTFGYDSETGKEFYSPLTQESRTMPIKALLSSGHIVRPQNNYVQEINTISNSAAFAVINTEGAGGSKAMARTEHSDVLGAFGSGESMLITIDNTSKTGAAIDAALGVSGSSAYTAAKQTVVLFDGAGLVKYNKGINAAAPLPVGVIFGGDFGTRTLLQYSQVTQSIPIDMHTLTITANDETLLNQLVVEVYEAKVNGGTPVSTKLNLAGLISQSDFNKTTRNVPQFRFQANALTSLVLTVPAGLTISISSNITSVGKSFNMVKPSFN